MASAAKKAAAKRIEFLLNPFLLLTTAELIAVPPLTVIILLDLLINCAFFLHD
jgi:hypothetical protein